MLLDASLRATLALVVLSLPAAAQGADHAAAPGADKPAASVGVTPAAAAEVAVIAAQKPSYPMDSCVVCAKVWGAQDTPLDLFRQGRLVRVCNAECAKAFDSQPAKWFKALDEQVIAAQSATYPLTHCPVTGEDLGSKPKLMVLGTRMLKLCCGDCRKELLTDPKAAAAALAKIDEGLIAEQAMAYPLKTCVVDDKPLGEAKIQMLYGVTLVRFCSDACEAKFKAGPKEFSAKLESLRHGGTAAAPKSDKPKSDEAKPGR